MTDESTTEPVRRRTYEWADPVELAGTGRGLAGLEFLTGLTDGRLPPPPVATTTGIEAVEFGAGRAVFALTPAEWQYNPIGSVHGGILATLADSALGCAVHSALPAGTGYTSLDLVLKFTRAVTVASGRVVAVGEVVSLGRRVATSQVTLTDAAGRVVAHGTSTCLVMGPA
jgi:uncharacterized protein (TIGR00369 family)